MTDFSRKQPVRRSLARLKKAVFTLCVGILSVLSNGCSDPQRLVGRFNDSQLTPPISGPFSAPIEISELTDASGDQQDPTLTGDELEIYFTRTLTGQADIWSSTRPSRTATWSPPERVAELSSDYNDATPEVSADGLTLYLASSRGDGSSLQLWRSQRSTRSSVWEAPVPNTNPPPGSRDLSPSLDSSGLWLAFGSVRGAHSDFDLYLTQRAAPSEPWGPLQALDSLNVSNADDFDPALFLGATQLLFSSLRDDTGDVFQSERRTTDEPFALPTPVTELNSTQSEGDPWVSADGHRVYFASNRSGIECMYQAAR